MSSGPQKPDHGGNFFMVPRQVIASVAWRHISLRARCVLQILQSLHNGFNNGRIGVSIHEIGRQLGDQNHGANGRAVAELIEKGFVECMSDASRNQSRSRSYRLTFISTGEGKFATKPTHEYRDWRPQQDAKRKFGGARTAPRRSVGGADAAGVVKDCIAATASQSTESSRVSLGDYIAVTAPYIVNQSVVDVSHPKSDGEIGRKSPAVDLRTELDTLRKWASAVRDRLGYGAQKHLSESSGVPAPTLSRFLSGKGLPDRYRNALQLACGRILPFAKWERSAGGVTAV